MTSIITSVRGLFARYPVLFCDVWGVLHDGVREYASAGDALERYRAAGGRVILVSNAPYPADHVAAVLAEKQVRRSAWDDIVSSGDVTREHLLERGYRTLHHIGPPRAMPLFEGLPARLTALEEAEALVCTGVADDRNQTGDSYRPLLQLALERSLPLVCANPDRVVDVGGRLFPCAGAVAAVYEEIGGSVYWAGKPYRPAYDRAFGIAAARLGRAVAPSEVLAIGDAVATDLAGARAAGLAALFVTGGIHRSQVMAGEHIDAAALARLLAEKQSAAIAAITALSW